ncbi:L-threonine 3-dehydrogenase [bacterium]|nr:MAG: L-threonine 3-dehydrogenase [bacterium]
MKNILIIGACGQIGSELTPVLRERYGNENVVAADIKHPESEKLLESGPFESLDIMDKPSIDKVIEKYNIDTIYNMAAILSAKGEKNPRACWDVNIDGVLNVLQCAIDFDLARIIMPSSIAVFGPDTPRENTPNDTILRPTTMYGVTKVCGERLCDYYVRRFGVDVRGLRYPGIISAETLPGGGTTDYAVEIFYKAVEFGRYSCFLREDTRLPMMYMPDCIEATLQLAEADFDNLIHHNDFNVSAFSFTPGELVECIKRYMPDFECTFEPDYRQEIADSWPSSIDDTPAREEWGWKPKWNLDSMTKDMLEKLSKRHKEGRLYK